MSYDQKSKGYKLYNPNKIMAFHQFLMKRKIDMNIIKN